jgi:hypothetical protein
MLAVCAPLKEYTHTDIGTYIYTRIQIHIRLKEFEKVRGSRDESVSKTWKALLYAILGRFNTQQLPAEVVSTIEDYMWVKLRCLWERDEPLPDWLGR